MSYDHSKHENRLRASALLQELKGKLTDIGTSTLDVKTMTAASSLEWWRLSKVEGVHVYQADDGWHADVVFSNLPPGVPTIIGSPGSYQTRSAALNGAIRQLSILAVNDKLPPPRTREGFRWFKFDNVEVPVNAELIETFPERLAAEGYTDFKAKGRLAWLRNQFADDNPMTAKIFQSLDQDDQNSIRIACAIALALNVHQFSIEDGLWSEFSPSEGTTSTIRM
ncbi:hypothetical protein [Bosea sp. AS-1]|uniref:hypothetical protein n=1 Tax=Bosea sp. AS-1 TaxID=2015316 RepID=UPI000B7987A0|nr:hypothetical protein [Bosea sp. AS-1]